MMAFIKLTPESCKRMWLGVKNNYSYRKKKVERFQLSKGMLEICRNQKENPLP